MKPLQCTISYSSADIQAITASLLTGFLTLEQEGILKIDKIIPQDNYKKLGYLHNAIIEVKICGKTIAYDTGDGYQSLQKKEMFDDCLDRLDAYFKISYDPDYQKGLRGEHKVMSLGLTHTGILCKNNPFVVPSLKRDGLIAFLSKIKRYNENLRNGNIKNFLSRNCYEQYKFLFWTRLWENSTTDEEYNRIYPYLSAQEAHYFNSGVKEMINSANVFRINTVKLMKEQFGDQFIYGIYKNKVSERLCPELLCNCPELDTKGAYQNSLKQNYICINTEGLHHCYPAKVTEFLASGRAVISQEFYYELPVRLVEHVNYIPCSSAEQIVSASEKLINDIEKIHKMEIANHDYFINNCLPEHIIRQSLIRALPEYKF